MSPPAVAPSDTSDRWDPATLRELARGAAERAADLLLGAWDRPRALVATKTTRTDVVTEMDRAAEELIVRHLLASRPDDGIEGEEGTDRRGTSGLRWVVDPLDGTTNYLYRHPGWCVSIGVEAPDDRGRELIAGVVVDPVLGEVFEAHRDGPALRNGRPIRANDADDLSTALVATGFGYAAERRAAQARVVAGLLPEVRDIRRVGSAALDLCSVACGRVDAYFEHGVKPWDLFAGGLIARQAGAVVEGIGGGTLRDGSVVAAPPGLFGQLRERLVALGADRLP